MVCFHCRRRHLYGLAQGNALVTGVHRLNRFFYASED